MCNWEQKAGNGSSFRPTVQLVIWTAGHKEEQRTRRLQHFCLAPAWNGVSSLSGRPPSTKFSGWRSRLHSVSSPPFFVPFSLLFLLFPGSGCGKCDTVSIYKVQQLCLGNFNAVLFQLCMQCSQLNWLIKENLVVQGSV